MRLILLVFVGILGVMPLSANAQEDALILSFDEYIAQVKKFHPMAKQAALEVTAAQAKLLESRGGFDPKLELDLNQKQFKGSEYYDLLNATFKVPTWYGIELKAGFEQNEGIYLNPERTVPQDGLYQAGISLSVAQGLIIDKRRATLRKAQWFLKQSEQERELAINNLIYQASLAYFDWVMAYETHALENEFLVQAQQRFKGIKTSAELGDLAAIDTVEAAIPVQNRRLLVEQARIDLVKKRLELSNYLWIQDDIPLELRESVRPQTNLQNTLSSSLQINPATIDSVNLSTHPKIMALEFKSEALKVDRRLKANALLPQIDLQFNALTVSPDELETFNANDYKFGVQASFPLFLRKEREALKLAKIKLQDLELTQKTTQLTLGNKIDAIRQEVDSYDQQLSLNAQMVDNYQLMLEAELKKFDFGESSIFLVNNRELKLVDARKKQIELKNKFYATYGKLYNSLGRIN